MGAQLLYLGIEYQLQLRGEDRRNSVDLHTDEAVIRVSATDSAEITWLLERWYRNAARNVITARVAEWARELGVVHGRIAIRAQRTRWGSCSTKGNLNFNWRLLMAPLEVVDYVVVHELVHLTIPHHGAAFWREVEHWCPERKRYQRWLRDHGSRLASILPT
jgi:predicted metal-dependent hydrolase